MYPADPTRAEPCLTPASCSQRASGVNYRTGRTASNSCRARSSVSYFLLREDLVRRDCRA